MKIKKTDIENIITCIEIHTKEYLDRREILREKIREWEGEHGEINKKYKERLDDIRNDILCDAI
jgi:hypothetical protein